MKNLSIYLSMAVSCGVIALFLVNMNVVSKRIAYVETHRLVASYIPTHELGEDIKKDTKEFKRNMDSLSNVMKQELMEYEQVNATLSEPERTEWQEKLSKRQKELEFEGQKIKEEMAGVNKEKMEQIGRELNAVIKEYGEEHDYDLILGATGNGTLAYANDAINVTEDIIDRIESIK